LKRHIQCRNLLAERDEYFEVDRITCDSGHTVGTPVYYVLIARTIVRRVRYSSKDNKRSVDFQCNGDLRVL